MLYLSLNLLNLLNIQKESLTCVGLGVRCTRPSYVYRALLVYVEPIAELEAVDTPPIKEQACLKEGNLIRLL